MVYFCCKNKERGNKKERYVCAWNSSPIQTGHTHLNNENSPLACHQLCVAE